MTASTLVRHVEHVMGMPVSFAFRQPVPAELIAAAVEVLRDIDARFSTYKADSEISRLDRGEVDLAHCSPDVAEVLTACEALHVATGGYFDAWATPAGTTPHLDPSGYVKGWAVERAGSVLDAGGIADWCINAGGDVATRTGNGSPPWRIGIRHPEHARVVVAVVAAANLAVATSGAYLRGEHIIDPHTGRPPSGLASITIVGPSLATADAYATAAFARGPDGLRWAAGLADHGVFAVLAGRAVSNPEFARHRIT
jgi:thiamine biosynthesis lipoprotein